MFGYGSTYSPIGAVATETYRQVVAVTPYNETLVDPDYWDLDEFHPSAANFDKFDWTLTKVCVLLLVSLRTFVCHPSKVDWVIIWLTVPILF